MPFKEWERKENENFLQRKQIATENGHKYYNQTSPVM